MKRLARLTLLVMVLLVAGACRQQTLSVENINLNVSATDQLVGDTTLIVAVTDDEGNPIENPGTLSVRGDMDHAGMTPVIVEASESTEGVFTVPFEWTMGGAWTLEVKLTMSNGEVATETFDYEILTEAGEEGDMEGMDMDSDDDMEGMEHDSMNMGETSAVYMSISNNGAETVTITRAETDVASLVEIHETIVENDVARMSPVEAIVVQAGETVELRPGGMHIMLMQLTQDIATDDEVAVTLQFDSGETTTVSAVVQDMLMDDLTQTFEVGDLVISNVWARPASSGMAMDEMDDMDSDTDMDMDSEDEEPSGD